MNQQTKNSLKWAYIPGRVFYYWFRKEKTIQGKLGILGVFLASLYIFYWIAKGFYNIFT